MLYCNRIDTFEGIDINKTKGLNKGFKFRAYVCNRCHDLLMMSMNLNDIAIN